METVEVMHLYSLTETEVHFSSLHIEKSTSENGENVKFHVFKFLVWSRN